MISIIFESHATTTDNANHIATGWYDVGLSPLGEEQARELGERYSTYHIEAIFCSDLLRSYKTAELAFANKYPVIKDARLRECNYGDMNQAPKAAVEAYKTTAITTPYPNGESYQDTSKRMKAFLQDLITNHNGKTVMIVGHRATQYGLDQWLKGMKLKDAVLAPWTWQPGWKYELQAEMLV
jgi:broad specificity phosphatase PhoE